jgi:hypothetical protein
MPFTIQRRGVPGCIRGWLTAGNATALAVCNLLTAGMPSHEMAKMWSSDLQAGPPRSPTCTTAWKKLSTKTSGRKAWCGQSPSTSSLILL